MLMNDSSNVMNTIAPSFTRDSGEPISVIDRIHRRYPIKLHQERPLFDIVNSARGVCWRIGRKPAPKRASPYTLSDGRDSAWEGPMHYIVFHEPRAIAADVFKILESVMIDVGPKPGPVKQPRLNAMSISPLLVPGIIDPRNGL